MKWASSNRTTRPLVWVHGASVGEGLTAVPVIDRLRAAIPGVQIAHSFTSPSAVRWSTDMRADRSDFLPLDERTTWADVFDAMRPSLLVCSRGDLWPAMTLAAAARRLPVTVIAGTVRPSSRRLRAPFRHILQSVYREITWLGAASDEHAQRWASLGVPGGSIAVTGDTRHDQVLERVTDLQSLRTLLSWSHGSTVLVAGSTEARDEELVLNAFSRVTAVNSDARLVLVPHDCSRDRLSEVILTANKVGIETEEWTGGRPRAETRVVVVNVVGILADIYAVGEIAYVGGGFHHGGLHAVVEPAALAVPVIVGPHYEQAADAQTLVNSRGAKALTRRSPRDCLISTWLDWLLRPHERVNAGLRARGVLHQGAAQASTAELLRLLGPDYGTPATPELIV